MEAWCVSCQIHTGNSDGYEAHLKTPRHKMVSEFIAEYCPPPFPQRGTEFILDFCLFL